MTDVLTQVLVDLEAEGDRLEQLVAGLDDDGWRTPTPAPGWDVATQVAHLAWTDVVALKAATDKEGWDAVVARLMETWAHSLDVHEALGADVEDTDRIRHVAHLGVRTRNFAFSVHGLEPPADEFRIDLASPSGEVWSWGPEDAGQTLTGSAGDFCRLVTQRVHRADTDLVASGADVDRWLDIAQAFAGQPGEGRAPR
jgi:hypothetical protein